MFIIKIQIKSCNFMIQLDIQCSLNGVYSKWYVDNARKFYICIILYLELHWSRFLCRYYWSGNCWAFFLTSSELVMLIMIMMMITSSTYHHRFYFHARIFLSIDKYYLFKVQHIVYTLSRYFEAIHKLVVYIFSRKYIE